MMARQPAEARPVEVRVAEQVAHVLDRRRVDPLLGLLLPGLGDLACGAVGLAVVALAAWRKVPRLTLARMLLNLAIGVGVGAIPLVGDAFDFCFRANSRNARLLAERCRHAPHPWRDALALSWAALLLVLAASVPLLVCMALVRWLLGCLQA